MSHELPGGGSPFAYAYRNVMGRLRGPIGCLVATLLLPFVLVAILVSLAVAMWKVRHAVRAGASVLRDAAPRRSTDREVALATFARSMAMDETFTREEALQSGTLAQGGLSPAELLDLALERGWVERRGERFAVTSRGRAEADASLARAGL